MLQHTDFHLKQLNKITHGDTQVMRNYELYLPYVSMK